METADSNPHHQQRSCHIYPTQDPVRFVTSYVVSPAVLAIVRTILALFAVATLIGSIVEAATADAYGVFWLFYLTRWSYVGLTVYFVIAASCSLAYVRQIRRLPKNTYPIPATVPPKSVRSRLLGALYVSVIPIHILVPVVFFTLLYDPSAASTPLRQWIQIGQHGTDLVTILIELCLSRVLIPWVGLAVVLIVALLYVCWMWIVQAAFGVWPYPFLNFANGPPVAGAYIGVLVGFIVAFVIAKGATHLREYMARRTGRNERFAREVPASTAGDTTGDDAGDMREVALLA